MLSQLPSQPSATAQGVLPYPGAQQSVFERKIINKLIHGLSNEPAQSTSTKSDSNLITASTCHCCGGQVLDPKKPLSYPTKIKVNAAPLDTQSPQCEIWDLAVEEHKLCNCFWYLVQAALKSFTNKFKIITGYSLVHFAEAQIQPKCRKGTKQK